MKKIALLCLLILGATTSVIQAHTIWINCFESHAHKPPHAIVSIGWGHMLPMDDILNSTDGHIEIKEFTLLDPNLNEIALRKPAVIGNRVPDQANSNVDIFNADLATQKLSLKEDSASGVYQLSAVSVPTYFTQYIDKKGRKRLKQKPINEIRVSKGIKPTKFMF
ncbi:DUF4198 domain-containing protein [uncultured Desulfobacter sp.]|uniref:DUF4198 domain-containing protein n=1 Tax=uncultured Desulfobacter sp. TaxID=240139 RepID=UPI0029F5A626|nr:DUF4198 domain-containing protein [uncultured Desulfobacter sp.]